MPPVFLITYKSARQSRDTTHQTEWICDANYDRDRARASFEAHCPTASVVSVEPLQCP